MQKIRFSHDVAHIMHGRIFRYWLLLLLTRVDPRVRGFKLKIREFALLNFSPFIENFIKFCLFDLYSKKEL